MKLYGEIVDMEKALDPKACENANWEIVDMERALDQFLRTQECKNFLKHSQ